MPFTLCHPALVLPLYRKAPGLTSLAALVIGSMAPDFVYFFPFGVSGSFSHSALGALAYCVPAGGLIYLLYQTIFRPAMLCWLPPAISARMMPARLQTVPSLRGAGIVIGSLLIGAASHICWDTFTHDNSALTGLGALLRTQVAVGTFQLPLYKILQHMSSLLGSIVIARYTFLWFTSTEPVWPVTGAFSDAKRIAIGALVVLAGLSGGVMGMLRYHTDSLEHALFVMVVNGMAASAVAIAVLCLGWTLRSSRRTARISGRDGK